MDGAVLGGKTPPNSYLQEIRSIAEATRILRQSLGEDVEDLRPNEELWCPPDSSMLPIPRATPSVVCLQMAYRVWQSMRLQSLLPSPTFGTLPSAGTATMTCAGTHPPSSEQLAAKTPSLSHHVKSATGMSEGPPVPPELLRQLLDAVIHSSGWSPASGTPLSATITLSAVPVTSPMPSAEENSAALLDEDQELDEG